MHNGNKKIVAGMMAGFCVLSSQALLRYELLVRNGGINSIIGKNSSSCQVFGTSEGVLKLFSICFPQKFYNAPRKNTMGVPRHSTPMSSRII